MNKIELDPFNTSPVNYVLADSPVVNSTAPIKSSDLTNTDMNSLPFSLTYGEENGPIVPTSQMSIDQFTKSITGVNLNYDYVNLDKGTSDSDYLSDFMGSANALGTKVVSGLSSFYNEVSEQVGSVLNVGENILNNIWYKMLFAFAFLLVAIWIIAKSGILKQAAAFV